MSPATSVAIALPFQPLLVFAVEWHEKQNSRTWAGSAVGVGDML
jgi:hypothetical protein